MVLLIALSQLDRLVAEQGVLSIVRSIHHL
jgi:hypothetical protein